MPQRQYALGQQVRLKTRWGQPPRTPTSFRITGFLPARDDTPHYRMRSDEERHERVASEDSLEALDPLAPASPAGRA